MLEVQVLGGELLLLLLAFVVEFRGSLRISTFRVIESQ
jgi:hypothetical protein